MDIDAQRRLADPLRFEVPATAQHLGQIRSRLSGWLEPLGLSGVAAADIVLAVNEACSNCIEHAYRDTEDGVIEIEASVQPDAEGGYIAVCIADFGTWRTPTTLPTTRGRGLPIMAAISDDVALERTSAGTTVRITFELSGVAGRSQRWGSRTT